MLTSRLRLKIVCPMSSRLKCTRLINRTGCFYYIMNDDDDILFSKKK